MVDCIKKILISKKTMCDTPIKKKPKKAMKKKPKKKSKKKRVKKTVSISNKNSVKVVIINQPKTKSKRKTRMRSRSLPIQIHDPVRHHQKAYTPTFHRPLYNGVEGTVNPTANQILNQKKIDLEDINWLNPSVLKTINDPIDYNTLTGKQMEILNRHNAAVRMSGGEDKPPLAKTPLTLFDSDDDDQAPKRLKRKGATPKQAPRFTSTIAERTKQRRTKSLTSTLKNSADEVKKKMSSRF